MKRILCFLLAFTFSCTLAACGGLDRQGPAAAPSSDAESSSSESSAIKTQVLRMKILRARDNNVWTTADSGSQGDLVLCFGISHVPVSGDAQLQPGMVIDVEYDGTIRETYPSSITPIRIDVVRQEEDFAGFYYQVLEDLYQEDSGLNGGAEVFGYDLSKASNLSEPEKQLLGYLFSSDHQVDWVFGTFEELAEQGYIDEQNLYWEDGLLFKIQDAPVKNDAFTFQCEKWKSGLGAIYFQECTAKKEDSAWTYEIGAFAIS